MPRVTVIDDYIEGGISDAIEWIIGDQITFSGTIEDADGDAESITGATIQAILRFYHANVEVTRNSRQVATGATVDRLVRDTDREDRTLDAVVDPDQTANRGKFTVTVPSDLYAAPQPSVNITRGVPVVVGFIKTTQGTEVRQSRFLMILRAGA